MAFRLFRRMKVLPGVYVNISKSGPSLSVGPRGAKVTVGSKGVRSTYGIPGTGMYFTENVPHGGSKRKRKKAPVPEIDPERRLTIGFFKSLITPTEEVDFVEGCKFMISKRYKLALDHFQKGLELADCAYMAGYLAIKDKQFENAVKYLNIALSKKRELGIYFSKYEVSPIVTLPITEEITAQIDANKRGILLTLAEVLQELGWHEAAIEKLQILHKETPFDIVVKLSLAELLYESADNNKATFKSIIKLADNEENESAIHTALLLLKAKALKHIGLLDAAKEVLGSLTRRKKDRPEELLTAVKYERALVYEQMGKAKKARTEFEKIYSESPNYEDVAQRLGI